MIFFENLFLDFYTLRTIYIERLIRIFFRREVINFWEKVKKDLQKGIKEDIAGGA